MRDDIPQSEWQRRLLLRAVPIVIGVPDHLERDARRIRQLARWHGIEITREIDEVNLVEFYMDCRSDAEFVRIARKSLAAKSPVKA